MCGVEVHAEALDRIAAEPRMFSDSIHEQVVDRTTEFKQRFQFGGADHLHASTAPYPCLRQRRQRMGFVREPGLERHGRT